MSSDYLRLLNVLYTLNLRPVNYVKGVRIGSFSGPYFLAFGLNKDRYGVSLCIQSMRENLDQKNSEYGQFSRSNVQEGAC